MNWYYAEAGKQAGPVTEAQLDEMVRSRKLPSDTLVWREGLANWQPYHQVKSASAGSLPTMPSGPGSAPVPEAKPATWFYEDVGKPTGPISDADLESLVASGRVRADTRVWREGMANWMPYAHARGLAGSKAAPSSVVIAPGGPGEVVCAECNRVFTRENVIQYGSVSVCANCKPAFLQKLREGVGPPGIAAEVRYAGFWIRAGAKTIDGLVLFVPFLIAFLILFARHLQDFLNAGLPTPASVGAFVAQFLLFFALYFVVSLAYHIFLVGRYGATLGKMACGIKVVTSDGGDVSYLRATGRYFAEKGIVLIGNALLAVVGYVDYIVAAFDKQKRALHDFVCNTRVIYK